MTQLKSNVFAYTHSMCNALQAKANATADRYGRSLLAQIRNHYQKLEHQFVSIDEFCQYTGLKAE